MREIKFRTVYERGSDVVFKVYTLGLTPDYQIGGGEWTSSGFEIIDRQMFTGLHDKNGKEIYEGDIVRDHYGTISQIKWDENGAGFIGWNSYTNVDDEIIGNIYENPELLAPNEITQ